MNKNTLKQLLIVHEGVRLYPYYCTAGKLTIGVGRNLQDRGLRQDEVEFLLENDIEEVLANCMTLPYWKQLDAIRQCIIADMIFNLGLRRFLGFRKLNQALQQGDYIRAAHEMRNSRWYSQVGGRGVRLVNAMISGQFSTMM